MADDVNANIRIDLDTSDAIVALRNLQSQISTFNQSVIQSNSAAVAAQRGMLSTLTAQIGATGQFTTSMTNVENSVSRLGRAIDKNKLTLGEYFRYGVASSQNFGRIFSREHTAVMELAADRVKRLQTQYIAMGEAQNGVTRAMAVRPMNLFNADAAIAVQRQQLFNKLLHDGSTSLINFGKNTQWAGRQLMVGFTVPLTIFGGMAGKIFMDLEKQVVKFRRVYGDATTPLEETNGMIDQVKQLAGEFTKYGIAVSDTISLAGDAAAAGAQGEDLISATTEATRLSTLGMIDQQQALTATIALQSAFRLSSEELANATNFLNAVENQTVVSLADITEAIPKVAPVIQGLGGDVQDLAIFMAAMREGGVSAGEGANALKSGLASLINPTKNAREQLEKVGINIDSILSKNKGDIRATVMAFGEALMGLDKFSRQQTLAKVFGKYQFARLGALFENIGRQGSQAQRVIDLTAMSIENLGALAEKELSAIEESVGVRFTGAVERLKLAIAPVGEAFLKIATPIIEFATKLFEKFNELSPSVKNFGVVLVAGLGVVVPTVIMLIGLFANFAGNAIKGLALMNNFFNRLKGGAGTLQYLSNEQIDAAAAAASLELQTNSLTGALSVQSGVVNQLAKSYGIYAASANAAAANLPQGFRKAPKGMATGGLVGGTGNKDSEPTLLTPGEFVMNREATQKFGPVLDAMNRGTVKELNDGSELSGVPQGRRSSLEYAHVIDRVELSMDQMVALAKKLEEAGETSGKAYTMLDNAIKNNEKVFGFSNLGVPMRGDINVAMGPKGPGAAKSDVLSSITATGAGTAAGIVDIFKQRGVIDDENSRKFADAFYREFHAEISQLPKDVLRDADLTEPFKRATAKAAKQVSEEFAQTAVKIIDEEAAAVTSIVDKEGQKHGAAGRATISSRVSGATTAYTSRRSKRRGLFSFLSGRTMEAAAAAAATGGGAGIPPGPTPTAAGGDFEDSSKKLVEETQSTTKEMSKTKSAAKRFGSTLVRGSAKMQGALFALDGLVFGASMMDNSIGQFAQKILPAVFAFQGISMALPMVTRLLPLLANPIGALVAITAATVGGFLLVKKVSDDLARRGRELSDSMIGTSESLNNAAKYFDKQTYAQQLAETRVEAATGTNIGGEAVQEAQGFVSSDVGQALLNDIKKVRELAGDESATEALQNRLQSMMLSGLIGPKVAYAIATEIGTQLGDTQISVDASARIRNVVGYNGENLEDNDGRMKILADIIADTTSLEDTFNNAGLIWDGTNWFMQAVMIVTGKGTSDIVAENMGANIVNAQKLLQEQLAKNRLEFERGEKSAREFYETNLDILAAGKQVGTTYENSVNALKKAYAGTNLIHEMNIINGQIFNGFATAMDLALGNGWKKFVTESSTELESSLITVADNLEGNLEYAFDGLKVNLLDPADIQSGISYYDGQMEKVEQKLAEARKINDQESIDKYSEMLDQLEQSRRTLTTVQGGAAKLQLAVQSNVLSPEALNNLFESGKASYLSLTYELSVAPDASAQLFYQLLEESGGKGFKADFAINVLGWNEEQISAMGADLYAIMSLPPVLANPILIEWEGMTPEQISEQLSIMNAGLTKFQDMDTVKEVKVFWNDQSWAKNFKGFVIDWKYIAGLDPLQKSVYMNYIQNIVPPKDPQERRLWENWISRGGIPGIGTPQETPSEEDITPIPEDTKGGEKTKSWLEQLLADTKANIELFVGNLEKGIKPLINKLRKFNIPEQIIDAIGTGEEGRKRAQELLGMGAAQRREFINKQNQSIVGQFLRGPGGLNAQLRGQTNRNKAEEKILSNRKINKDFLKEILDDEKAVNAILAARGPELDNILNRYEQLQTVQDVVDQKVKEVKDSHEETEKILNKQIEDQEKIVEAIQTQIDAIEQKNEEDRWTIRSKEREKELIDRQIESLDRANEIDQRKIDNLQRQDELRNREADALSRELDAMSQLEEQIRKTYQERVDSLDRVAEVNNQILEQQKQQLGLSQALSQGDIFAATAAVQEMRQSQVQFAQQQARAGLEQGMENAVGALRTSGGMTREQAEERIRQIKDQSYQTSLAIREIEDRIYERNQQIIPLKDQQRIIDDQIRIIEDQIYARETDIYNMRKNQLTPAEDILSNLNDQKTANQKITDELINQIEALADTEKGTNNAAKKADALAKSWYEVQKAIANANKLANNRLLTEVGDPPTRQAGDTDAEFAKKVEEWKTKRQAILNQRNAEIDAALSSGTSSMNAANLYGGGKVMKYGMGKKVMGYAAGSIVGAGSRDSVPAMLTPGEFVIRKTMVDKYGTPLLQAINQGAFGMPRFNTAQVDKNVSVKSQSPSNIVAPMYNNYSVNVSVSGTNASADEIANKTIMKIKQMQDMQIRSGRGY